MASRLPSYVLPLRQPFLRPRTLPLVAYRRGVSTAAPRIGGPPTLLEYRSDRPLPEIKPKPTRLLSIPLFLLTLAISAAAIFNYQKSSSSVVTSTMYALRNHPRAREALGDHITYAWKWPYIFGELDQFHGKIDIWYAVKGSKGEGVMRFKSVRNGRMGLFETQIWELTMTDGRKIELLDRGQADPFPQPTP
ncbi:cytochrome oxidase assembly protein 1 [Rhizina undulata]